MRIRDLKTLIFSRLKIRRGRLLVILLISSVLFGVNLAGVLFLQGIENRLGRAITDFYGGKNLVEMGLEYTGDISESKGNFSDMMVQGGETNDWEGAMQKYREMNLKGQNIDIKQAIKSPSLEFLSNIYRFELKSSNFEFQDEAILGQTLFDVVYYETLNPFEKLVQLKEEKDDVIQILIGVEVAARLTNIAKPNSTTANLTDLQNFVNQVRQWRWDENLN